MRSDPRMKILVVKPTALGDVAQALAVAPILKQAPDCSELVWLVDEEYAPLLRLCPWVDRLILFPRRRWRFPRDIREINTWLAALRREHFDLVLDLQGLARSGVMTRVTGAPRRIGLASAREFSSWACNEQVQDRQKHAVDRYLAAAQLAAGSLNAVADAELLLRPPAGDLPAGLESGTYTVLHPYSKWETKLWPWQNYEALMQACPEETFVLAGHGPFFPVSAANCIDLRNQTDLTRLLAILGHARVVISTDSGPLHLAAALGRPLVALFGATDPERTGPRGRTSATVLTTGVSCRPCLSRHCRRNQRMACLVQVDVATVQQAWMNLAGLAKYSH